MIRARANSLPLALSVLALLGPAMLYASFRQHIFTIDSLYYLWDTEFASWRQLFHPHHLLLEPILRGWWRLWQWFGWPGQAVTPLQTMNVLVTLGSVFLAGRLLNTLLRDRTGMLLWWLLLSVVYLPWYHATQTEGVPLFALFGTANLLWAATLPGRDRDTPITPRTAVAVAATMTMGILIHQSLVLWAPLLAWMLGREAPPGRRWRYGVSALAGAGAVVLGCYLVAGAWSAGSLAPADLWRWATGYSQEFAGRCGSFRYLFSADLPRGLASSVLSGEPLKAYTYGSRPADAMLVVRLIPFAALGLFVASGLVRLPWAFRDRDGARRRVLTNVALLVLLGSFFAGWWEPSNRKFWAPVLPGVLALAAVGWCGWRSRRPRLAVVAAVLTVTMTLVFNLAGGILPRHRLHDDRQPLLVFLARSVRPNDTVILREDRVWQAAMYFRPQQQVHRLPGPNSDPNDYSRTVFSDAIDDAIRALTSGATLFVADREWPTVRAELERELGRLPEPIAALEFGDPELAGDEQVLLALRLPVS